LSKALALSFHLPELIPPDGLFLLLQSLPEPVYSLSLYLEHDNKEQPSAALYFDRLLIS